MITKYKHELAQRIILKVEANQRPVHMAGRKGMYTITVERVVLPNHRVPVRTRITIVNKETDVVRRADTVSEKNVAGLAKVLTSRTFKAELENALAQADGLTFYEGL